MRTILVFILFAILTSLSRTTTGIREIREAPTDSDLKHFTEDFRILARVTNAIYFHFAATDKSSKIVDNSLAEFIGIPTQSFYEILAMDPLNTTKEINRMRQEFVKFQKTYYPTKSKNMTTQLDSEVIKIGMKVLKFFGKLASLDNRFFNNVSKVGSDILIEGVKSVVEKNKLEKNCNGLDADNLDAFRLLFVEQTDEKVALQTIKTFMGHATKYIHCLDEIPKLQETLASLTIHGNSKTYEIVRQAKNIAQEYSVLYKIGPDLNEELRKLERSLLHTQRIWLGQLKDANMYVESLYDSAKTFSEIHKKADTIELSHTAGFKNSDDMLKVFDDLKSPWFQKNLVKGASIKNITKVLQPYSDIFKTINSLDNTWKQLVESDKNDLESSVVNGAEALNNITKYFAKIKTKNETLVDVTDTFFKCLKNEKLVFDPSILWKFEQQERPAENVVEQVNKLEETVGSLSSELKQIMPSGEEYGSRLKTLTTVLYDVINTTVHLKNPSALEFLNQMKVSLKFIGETDNKFFDTMGQIAEFNRELKALVDFSKKVTLAASATTTKKIKVEDILSQLKIKQTAACLNGYKKNISVVIGIYRAFDNILNFPSQFTINKLSNYMKEVEKIQNAIIEIPELFVQFNSIRTKELKNLLPSMNNSLALSENFGESIRVLEQMDKAREARQKLLIRKKFSIKLQEILRMEGLSDWMNPYLALNTTIKDIDAVNLMAKNVRNETLIEMTKVFEKAANIQGLPGKSGKLLVVSENPILNQNEKEFFETAGSMDLDFAKHQARLQNARVTVNSLKMYFDELFGHLPKDKTVLIEKQIPVSWLAIILIGIAIFFLLIILVLTLYGLTERGRAYYQNLYIYYFGKQEDFEKRWRYSLFMDTVDGKNSVLDAVREGNKANLLKALKNGAYIDAYNKFGNTALHMAVKFALPDHVELLIKHGADRNLLNYKNLTPIQSIPLKCEPERIPKYEKIRKIYKKYHKKSFRVTVPKVFPDSSYHIWPDESTNVQLTNKFLDAFRAITSDEVMPTTTHVVCKTDKDGVLETDNLDTLVWLFHGAIMVKEQWMIDCLEDEKLIKKDKDYLIEKVKYKGVIYDTVLQWSEAMAKSEMPYLLGVFVVVVVKGYENLAVLTTIVNNQGGTVMGKFPFKNEYNIGSRPYLHANRGPLFIIHDGTEDITIFKTDTDKMYTVFTEEEFIAFMLRREIHIDTRAVPPPIQIGDE